MSDGKLSSEDQERLRGILGQLEEALEQAEARDETTRARLAANLATLRGGSVHPETRQYIPAYLSDRPLLAILFDSRVNDAGLFRARELSYFLDCLDVRFIDLSIRAGHPHFLALSNYLALALLVAGACDVPPPGEADRRAPRRRGRGAGALDGVARDERLEREAVLVAVIEARLERGPAGVDPRRADEDEFGERDSERPAGGVLPGVGVPGDSGRGPAGHPRNARLGDEARDDGSGCRIRRAIGS